MRGFILAAGLGTRLQPITNELPKPLIPIWGVPAICYSLMLLREAGVNEVIINLHYKYQMIIDYLQQNNNFGFTIHFSYEKTLLGTGGGLKKCEPLLNDAPFYILNSDIITDIDLNSIAGLLSADITALPILVACNSNTATVSIQNDTIVDFKNYLLSNIDASLDYSGMALVNPKIFSLLSKQFSSIVYTAYSNLIQNSRLPYHLHSSLWEDIGSVENYMHINNYTLHNYPDISQRLSRALGIKTEYKKFIIFLDSYGMALPKLH